MIALAWILPRAIAAVAIATALAAGYQWIHGKGAAQGRAQVQAAWDADTTARTSAALAAEQAARATEQALQKQVRKVQHAYTTEQNRRAAADAATADLLRQLQAAAALGANPGNTASADSASPARADDDPRDRIIAECAATVVALDKAARGLAGQTEALQGYARSVCVSAPD